MYHCRIITDMNSIKIIYEFLMKKDFPPGELKPFEMIRKEIERDEYLCYGMFKEDMLCGYAFYVVWIGDDGYLLDYFAVTSARRNKGVGSAFLNMLLDEISCVGITICEVENPDYAENSDDREHRERRVNFYLRNGFVKTGVTARLFGVEYIILETESVEKHSENEIKSFYSEVYSRVVPKVLLKKKLVIH